jgi:hypothetical protein
MIKHWEKYVPNFMWEDYLDEIQSQYELKIKARELKIEMKKNIKFDKDQKENRLNEKIMSKQKNKKMKSKKD